MTPREGSGERFEESDAGEDSSEREEGGMREEEVVEVDIDVEEEVNGGGRRMTEDWCSGGRGGELKEGK